MNAIETENLTKYYGKSRGILHLDLTVEEGEFFGFIGPNGAGKSTTIRSLTGLITPTTGTIRIFGDSLSGNRERILQKIGYLPSEAAFYPGMKVKDILKLSASLRHKDCSAEAGRLCERLQLDPFRKVNELSFGNKKKTAIVCAILSIPELLILDEPFNGLDEQGVEEIRKLLLEEKEKGRTLLLSSHNKEDIQVLCDQVIRMDGGEVKEEKGYE